MLLNRISHEVFYYHNFEIEKRQILKENFSTIKFGVDISISL